MNLIFSEEIPENVRENDILMQAAQLVQRINAELDKNKLNMKIMGVCNGLIVLCIHEFVSKMKICQTDCRSARRTVARRRPRTSS